MTLAGAVGGRPPAYLKSLTNNLLDQQRIYGGTHHALVMPPGAALGVSHSPGRSPNLAKIGGWVLVADCRLDNRDELEQLVETPPQCTDAYLLLSIWLREGENSLARIAGDFAIAVFDPGDCALRLARDVTGQRPLFFTETEFGVAFASMAAGLRPAVSDFKVDRRSLARLAMDSPLAAGELFFDGVHSVAPAEVIRFSSNGTVARDTYWAPSLDPSDHGDRDALVDEYRHVLDEAVRPRLGESPLVVATHLSGGFDSSSVTATAARTPSRPAARDWFYVRAGIRNSTGTRIWLLRRRKRFGGRCRRHVRFPPRSRS